MRLRYEGTCVRCGTAIPQGVRAVYDRAAKAVSGVHKQTDLVRAALAAAGFDDVPVVGALCFVAADWPLIGGAFWIDKVLVAWPKKVADYVTADGDIPPERVAAVHRALAVAFPVA